ncbi:NAD(P)H-dependent oxidoreductase [Mucilaginibacter sp. CSA2-8R]|uniref:NAD(P)H-dependent oxidoreductase n=1 Tax=Mucilaginibacter sp. CSA2-8R TaxID=3141542 RepID=UPI00315CA836
MKTLVIVIHPDMPNSVINKTWKEALNQHPDRFMVHDLYEAYPDGRINVATEQRLMEQHDKIVFQFPFYWFNCPPLFKQWLDEVLTHGWAYGSKSGFKMAGKTIALAVSLGSDEPDYSSGGKYQYTLDELLRPFELSFDYVKAKYHPPFAWYGMEYNATAEWAEQSVPEYLKFLEAL